MSWLYTLTSGILVAALLSLHPPSVRAQTLEAAIMPGPVISGHADLEADCGNCHVRFDRAAQAGLCLDCHKPVRSDIAAGTGYHGRLDRDDRNCRNCHTDHKGRRARIVALDEQAFDHATTDFPLRGKHRPAACSSCHRANAKHRTAPAECHDCHRKDDEHRGGLGTKCGNCHGEETWREGRFDHGKTKFPLRRAHAAPDVKCADCHPDQRYADISRDCVACHRDDDLQNGHKGHFGNRCEKCHDEGDWKGTLFRHDRDTRYPLLDRHRTVKCVSCHRAPLFREKTPTRCVACHRDDDIHRNALGDRCDSCHAAKGWKLTRFDHDVDTRFVLRDKHRAAKCNACHKDEGMREKLATRCIACHAQDDREKGHKGDYGEKCETCHDARAFKPSIFDHGRDTKFALAGKHQRTRCSSCHREPLYRNKTAAECHACHKADDVHFSTYGLACADCHVPDDWRRIDRRQVEKRLRALGGGIPWQAR